jgi:phosphatidylglycerol:prolipoprotein diacylglycerol transferase
MLPILFRLQVGGTTIAIGAYSTFMLLACVATVAVGTVVAAKRGIPARKALAVFVASLVAAIAGGRLLDVLTVGTAGAENAVRLWTLTFQGFSIYGALVLGALAAIVSAAVLRLPIWRLADSAAPALAAGIALLRVGCFLRGCCFGVPTDLPWGVTFPPGSPAWEQQMLSGETGILGGMMGRVLPLHPTQLYELAAVLALGALAVVLMRRSDVPDGVPFLAFAIGYTLFRLGNGFLRPPAFDPLVGEWFYPAMYVAILIVLGALLAWRLRAGTRPRA